MIKCKLGDIAQSQTGPFGSQLHEEDYVDEGTPIVTVEHLGDIGFTTQNLPFVSEKDTERLSKYKLREGDIVFSRVGSIDRCVYVEKEQNGWLFSGRCLRVRCDNEKVNSRYLSYYFKLEVFKKMMLNISVGATMPSLNTDLMNSAQLILLERCEQDKVAELLDAIDSKINNNNKINTELEAMAKTIYDYWFLQFDFPDENGKPYRSSGGKMVWNEELGREIPEGWKRGYLKEYIGKEKGGDWGKDAPEGNYNTEVSCIRGADFPSAMGSKSLEAPIRYILSKNMYKVLKSGDIIVEISGGSPTQSTGRICYINEELLERFENDVITSNFCKAFSLTRSNILYWFYIFWCKLYESKVFFNYESKTTGIKNLLFDTLCEDYSIILPANKIIELYQERVSSMFEKIQKNLKENQELASLRDFLLPLLMNGQVRLKDE